MDIISNDTVNDHIERFAEANDVNPIMVFSIPTALPGTGSILPDERFTLVYLRKAKDCIHPGAQRTHAKISKRCGFDSIIDAEKVFESLLDRTCLSYDVFHADTWGTIYRFADELKDACYHAHYREGKYEMYNPAHLAQSYIDVYDKNKSLLDNAFEPDMFLSVVRMLYTAELLIDTAADPSTAMPHIGKLSEMLDESGDGLSICFRQALSDWASGAEEVPETWEGIPLELNAEIQHKKNGLLMGLHSVKERDCEPLPQGLLLDDWAKLVFSEYERNIV